MNKKNLFYYLLWFVAIEIIFLLLIFREVPHIWLFSAIWILHLLFFISIFISWYLRVKSDNLILKFIYTYTPVVLHLIIHIIVWLWLLHLFEHSHSHHHHDEHEIIWMIIWVIIAWIIIFIWEKLLHNKVHCETHHQKLHKSCHDKECTKKH